MEKENRRLAHPFEPVYNSESRILILGSFPSVRSREEGFFYGHPRNRFWKVTASLCRCGVPETVEQKKEMLLGNGIALWDSAAACVVEGSSDSSIREIVPNDIGRILKVASIERIFANGKTAGAIYENFIMEKTGLPITVLPSTSPANAAYSLERLIREWQVIFERSGK